MLRMVPLFFKLQLRLIIPFALIAVAAGAPPASAQEWAINKQLSRITFEVDAGGQSVAGEFTQFRAEIRFDAEHLDITEISAAIDTNTISTGQAEADKALYGKEWFDTQTYPAAGFQMEAIKEGDTDGNYVLNGSLTIKGKTRPVSIPFTLNVDQGEAKVVGETAISRREFGVGPDGPVSGVLVGDLVRIKLDLVATRLDN